MANCVRAIEVAGSILPVRLVQAQSRGYASSVRDVGHDRKRLMNILDVTDRISLDGQLDGRRRYCVGFIAAGAMFQGSSASMSASVVACGSFSKMWRR